MSVTIKDIASASGVSYSTVSKALNGSPLVKPETKRKVLKVAKQLGYQPNLSARSLVSKKSNTIGVVWPTIERIALSALITKINEIIEENHYSMILSINEIKSSVEMFRRFQVDGIIIFEEEKVFIEPGILSAVPILSHGVPKENPYPVIDVNQKKAIHEAVEFLQQLNHTQICFIGDLSTDDPRQKEKASGFREGMKKFHLPVKKESMVDTSGLDFYSGYSATQSLLSNDHRPSAIIGGSYDICVGILRAIKEADLEIPEDISVIGYDNIPQMGSLETPLTSVGVPIDKLAYKMVDSLLMLIEQPDSSLPLAQTLKPELNDRGSCSPAPQETII